MTAELHEPSGKVLFRLPALGPSAAVDEAEAEQVIAEARAAIDEARQRRGGGALSYERALAVLCGDDGEAVG